MNILLPKDVKSRPIIDNPACPTHNVNSCIRIVLKPLCTYISSSIRNVVDFLFHLPQTMESISNVLIFDGISLYINTPAHNLGIKAMRYSIENMIAMLSLIESR